MNRASRAVAASVLAFCLSALAGPEPAAAQATGQATAQATRQATRQAAEAAATAPPAARLELAAWAERQRAIWSYDPLSGQGYIMRGPDLIRFAPGRDLYLVGPDGVVRTEAPTWEGGRIALPAQAAIALEAWLASRDEERRSRASVAAILIDPGHGGRDPGAIGEHGSGAQRLRIAEKDLTLAVGKDLYDRLRRLWPDKQIMITRDGDTYPSLDERVEMANKLELSLNQAVIYVSIHANASFNVRASGFEVWYLNPDYRRSVVDAKKTEGVDSSVIPILNAMLEEEYTTESVFLARAILDGMAAAVGERSPSRGIRAEEWFVVRNARMPSVLVEVGFVTNEQEARALADPAYLKKLGDGIYNGIVSFVEYFERRRGSIRP